MSLDFRTQRIAERMLQGGWQMLGSSCVRPECYAPLLKHKPTSKTYCVVCDIEYVTEKQAENMQLSESAPITPLDNVKQEQLQVDQERPEEVTDKDTIIEEEYDEEEWKEPTEEELAEYRKRREIRDQVSIWLGEKMLEGWAMLQDICERCEHIGVPLLREKDGTLHCVYCENLEAEKKKQETSQTFAIESSIPILPSAPVQNNPLESPQSFSPLRPQSPSKLNVSEPFPLPSLNHSNPVRVRLEQLICKYLDDMQQLDVIRDIETITKLSTVIQTLTQSIQSLNS